MTATKIIKMPNVVISIGAAFKGLYQQISSLGQKLSFFTLAQYLYFFAFLLAISSDSFTWVAAITVLALTIELLPLFERIWHSLLGKAVLLLFYAVVANFALSWAGGVVNEVIGVSAEHFAYTHNLAILLYIPVWFVFITALLILAAQMLVPFYFLLFISLKLLGVALPKLTQNTHFRKTTWILRLMLATGLLVHLVLYIVPEIENGALKKNLSADVSVGIEQPLITVSTDVASAEQDLQDEYSQTRHKYQSSVRKMIALFAFEFEADSKSRCQKQASSKVVELNDYEIVEIFRDDNQKNGFRFEVKKCISPAFPA